MEFPVKSTRVANWVSVLVASPECSLCGVTISTRCPSSAGCRLFETKKEKSKLQLRRKTSRFPKRERRYRNPTVGIANKLLNAKFLAGDFLRHQKHLRVPLKALTSCSYVLGVIYTTSACKIALFCAKRNTKALIGKLCITLKILIKFPIWKTIKINKIKNSYAPQKFYSGCLSSFIHLVESFS